MPTKQAARPTKRKVASGKGVNKARKSIATKAGRSKRVGPLSRAEKLALINSVRDGAAEGRGGQTDALKRFSVTTGKSIGSLKQILHRFQQHPAKVHGNDLLTVEQELMLVATVQTFAMLQRALTRSQFIDIARALVAKRNNWNPSGWAASFLKRWGNQVYIRDSEGIDAERVAPGTLDSVRAWVAVMESYITTHKLSMKHIVNADETRVVFTDAELTGQRLGVKGPHGTKVVATNPALGLTYIAFIVADGVVLFDLFILPTNNLQSTKMSLECLQRASRQHAYPTYWAWTDKGYMTSALWLPLMQEFHKLFQTRNPGLEPLLFVDNASVHKGLEAMKWCVTNKVHVAFFPPHTTHFLQPSDAQLFAAFKAEVLKQLRANVPVLTQMKIKLGPCVIQAAENARHVFTPKLIIDSFASVGLFPGNSKLILDRAEQNVTTTPPPEETGYVADLITHITQSLQDTTRIATTKTVKVPIITEQLVTSEGKRPVFIDVSVFN